MSCAEPAPPEPQSPLPDEPDITVSIRLTPTGQHRMTYVACETAARRFADHWRRYGRCGEIVFTASEPNCGRLPCERLWIVP